MADSIVRLKVDSREYDSKIKRACDGILALERNIRTTGETFIQTWKYEQDFARGLGQMETMSKSARGRIAELTSAITELSMVYRRMSDEEKNSPMGQALKGSIEQLSVRLRQEKKDLAEVTGELNNTGSVLDKLASKFTVNLDAMKLFDVGMKAVGAAVDVAKDAFFASEATVDEWGRITESAQSVYEGFLNAINNGDISGYLTRIDQIVEAARKAYNELDALGTMKTIQGPAMSKQEAENNRMRMMVMTGRYIAPTDGTPSAPGLKNGDLLSKEQIQNIERHLQNGMQTIVKLTKNELDQTGRAIDAYYEKLAKQNGMSVEEFRRGTSSWDAFQERLSGARELSKWEADHLQYNSLSRKYELTAPVPQELEKYRGWDTFRVDKMGTNSFNDLVNLIKQQQQQTQQLYSTIGQAYRTINRAEGITVRNIMGGGSGSGKDKVKTSDTEKAEAAYNQGLTVATEKLNAKVIKEEEYDKILLSNMQKLGEAYLKAYSETGNEAFLDKFKYVAMSAQAYGDAMTKAAKEIETQTGFSGVSQASLGAWKSFQQKSLSTAEYGSETYLGLKENIKDIGNMSTVMDAMSVMGLTSDDINMMLTESLVKGMGAAREEVMAQGGLDFVADMIYAGMDIPDEVWKTLAEEINKGIDGLDIKGISVKLKTDGTLTTDKQVKELYKDTQKAAGAMNTLGSALASLEDPSAKVAGIVMQSIANVALAFSEAMKTPKDPWSWIAFAAAGTAAMVSTIAAIHDATGYAEGGIVEGNSYSGDNTLIRANAGELILNKASQSNLANALEAPAQVGFGNVRPYMRNDDIYLGLRDYGRKHGLGDPVFART